MVFDNGKDTTMAGDPTPLYYIIGFEYSHHAGEYDRQFILPY